MPSNVLLCALRAAAAALALSLAAPAAQAAAARPNLEGVWTTYVGSDPVAFGFGAPKQLPFRPEAQAKVDEYQRITAEMKDNPAALCLGWGMPGSMLFSGGFPMQIAPGTDLITIIYEALTEIRWIHFGARVVPEADRFEDRNGYSVGRWEGDTLVVETTNLMEQVDQQYAHSAEARIVERYRLTDEAGQKVLVNDWTLIDPVFYTEPVSAQKKWAFSPTQRMLPYNCREQAWAEHVEGLRAKAAAAAGKAP